MAPASRRSPAEQPPRARRAAGAAARRGRGGKAETPAAGLAVQVRGVGRTSNSLGGTYCSASRLAFLLRWRCRKGGSRGPVPREARCCNRGFIAPLHLSALAEKTVTHIGGEAGSAQEQKADAHGAARLAAKPSRGGSGRHNRRWSGTAPQLCPLGRRRLLCCATKCWPCWPAAPRSQATHPAGRRCAGMPGGRDAALLALSLHRHPWFASNSAWTIHAQQAAGDPAEPTMRMHWSAYLHDEGAASEGSSSATQHGRHRQGMPHMRQTLLGMRQAPLNASRHVGKRGPQHPHLPRSQQVSAGQKGAPEAPLVLPGRSGQVASASGGLAARLAAPIFAAQLPASRRNSSSALPTSLL